MLPVTGLWAFWKELLLMLAAYSVVVGFILRALVDQVFIGSYTRNKDFVIGRHAEWWSHRMTEFDETVKMVAARGDQITHLELLVTDGLKQRESQSVEHHRQSTEAMALIAHALTAVQKEAQATAVAVGRIEGQLTSFGIPRPAGPFGDDRRHG